MMAQPRSWSAREWISRLLGGIAAGCLALCLFNLLVTSPFLGPTKNAQRLWVLRIPEFGLPAAILLGGLAGVIWRREREVRFSRSWLLGLCLAIVLMVELLRPAVSRIRTKGFGPLYEEVPDSLAMIFCVIGLLIVLFDRGMKPSGGSHGETQSSQTDPFSPSGVN